VLFSGPLWSELNKYINVNKFKNLNRYGRPIHVSSLYKFRLPKFNMPAAPLPKGGLKSEFLVVNRIQDQSNKVCYKVSL